MPTFRYGAFGTVIEIDRELWGCPVSYSSRANVRVQVKPWSARPLAPVVWYHRIPLTSKKPYLLFGRGRDRGHWICYPKQGEFLLSPDGRKVTVYRGKSTSWEPHLLWHVLPLALSLQGRLVLHAGVVASGGKALAFCGPSGAGKSTLLAACLERGMELVSDDALVLCRRGNAYLSLPALPQLKLRPGVWRFAKGAGFAGVGGKRQYLIERFSKKPVFLSQIFFLSRGCRRQRIKLRNLSPFEACSRLLPQVFRVDLTAAHRELGAISALLEAVPMCELLYPNDVLRLPDVVASLERSLDN